MASAGAPAPPGVDGVNLIPFLAEGGPGLPHPQLFWRMGGQLAIRVDRWKLVRLRPGGDFRLYDLEADEREVRNRADQEPARVRELQERLTAWEATLVPPRW
jgi:arylsulfatase A-like enzyme